MKVLIGIDSSTSSEALIEEVMARPWPGGTRFCVIHVVDLWASPLRRTGGRSFDEAQFKASEALVALASEKLASRGLEVVGRVSKGHTASKILEYSSEWDADYVIVGSRGRSGVKRFLLGSVAHAVLRHAACSVEIVRARGDRRAFNGGSMRILLATDGSEYSIAATQSVAERPWPAGAELRVISVVHAVDPTLEEWKGTPEDIARIESDSLSQGEADVAAAQLILAGAGLKPVVEVLRGYPKEVILNEAEAWDADLIVLGSHGRRGVARMLMGSVSEVVAMHAHCSVEVIRP